MVYIINNYKVKSFHLFIMHICVCDLMINVVVLCISMISNEYVWQYVDLLMGYVCSLDVD